MREDDTIYVSGENKTVFLLFELTIFMNQFGTGSSSSYMNPEAQGMPSHCVHMQSCSGQEWSNGILCLQRKISLFLKKEKDNRDIPNEIRTGSVNLATLTFKRCRAQCIRCGNLKERKTVEREEKKPEFFIMTSHNTRGSHPVLYGCETWTLALREEQRLRVFENKILRKIFGAKRDEVTGEWRKLHNAELHALYSSPDIIRNIKSRRLRWAGHVARMGESRNAYRVLVGRPEGIKPLGRPRRRWEDNIKMDLREVRYDDRDWINLAQDRDRWRAYVRAAMNLWVP
ncbi:hypothetical protein ANN_00656 [Periplaneta americana]|uniref:Uncharacterized protein n=1 Tax=Periplaneta americana TaxID=6978 RepID=A0ABQ8TRE7_PERAM|nr:hypothetical protein ANN_00656 [Periplaneta americana]